MGTGDACAMTRLPCPKCGPEHERIVIDQPNPYGNEWCVSCSNCYDADCVGDPPEYVSSSITGWGHDQQAAIEDWNYMVEESLP